MAGVKDTRHQHPHPKDEEGQQPAQHGLGVTGPSALGRWTQELTRVPPGSSNSTNMQTRAV